MEEALETSGDGRGHFTLLTRSNHPEESLLELFDFVA